LQRNNSRCSSNHQGPVLPDIRTRFGL